MNYIDTLTLEYPLTQEQIKNRFPQVSFPSSSFKPPDGYSVVEVPDPPPFDFNSERLIASDPVLVNAKWVQQWKVKPLLPEEILARKLALEKNLQDSIIESTQQRLDSFARTRNYDGILSACTYATSNIPKFAAEGQTAVNLRDATWAALYQILEEVQADQRETPSVFSDIEPLLPPLEWPV